ncbi:MAG: restriction endonuclease subunit S [Muribaculaceae bacterium]|nr:restriction endonuclease subunit S [Muribaculaceae bacterium]
MKHNWEYKPFGALCEIVRGSSPRPIQDYITKDENGLNWIKIGDVSVGSKYITSTKEKIKREGLKKTRQVFKGDFILSNSMSFGRPYILKIDGCIHDGWLAIKGVERNFIPDFLYYLISSPQTYQTFEKLAKGGVVNNLNSDLVKSIVVPIPPMEVQEEIVAELDKINEVMADCRELLRTLDSLAQSLFYDYFGDPVTNPKGWEIKSIQSFAKTTAGGTPSKSHPEYYENGTIKWLRSGEVCKMNIEDTELRITEIGMQNSSAKAVPENSVAVAMYGATAGQVGIIRCAMTLNQAICAIFPNNVTNSIYLYFCLTSLKNNLLKVAHGAAQPNISQSIIKTTKLPVPPLQLQEEFAARIEQIEEQKKAVEETISTLQTLLDSRMDYWFN